MSEENLRHLYVRMDNAVKECEKTQALGGDSTAIKSDVLDLARRVIDASVGLSVLKKTTISRIEYAEAIISVYKPLNPAQVSEKYREEFVLRMGF